MKAGVFLGPGEVEVREWSEPVAGPGQVKVKIAYTGICGSDVESLHHRMGFQRVGLNFDGSGPARTEPVVEGHEATGTIVELGPDLKGDWKVGQRLGLSFRAACGVCYYCRTKREQFCEHDALSMSSFAEYAVLPEGALYALPDDIPFELAALVEPLSIAVHAVDRAELQNGQTLVVSGAGTIGLTTLAVALNAGACKVLVLEPKAHKREIALNMGADMAVDPLTEDVGAAVAKLTGGRGFDKVIEASGNLGAATSVIDLADKGGTIVWVGVYPCNATIAVNPFKLYLKELTIRSNIGAPYAFERTMNLLPKLNVGSLVTNIYSLDDIAEAFRNHEKGDSIKTLIKP